MLNFNEPKAWIIWIGIGVGLAVVFPFPWSLVAAIALILGVKFLVKRDDDSA
jgi:lauroyl/myristoyl acyltransferase